MAQLRVTISCPCGNTLKIPYGERLVCRCERSWNTAQIPAADIAAVRGTAGRYRRNEVAFVLVALGITVALMLVARSAPLIVVFPAVILAWVRWFRPWWQHRRQARLTGLPTWNLTPEVEPPA